jgi:hypothetical protein
LGVDDQRWFADNERIDGAPGYQRGFHDLRQQHRFGRYQ